MSVTPYSKPILKFIGVLMLSILTACGDKENDEPSSDSSIEKLIIGKWEMYTSDDFEDSIGFEFKSDSTGSIWLNDEDGLIIGKIQYNFTVLGNSSDEKVIRIKGADFDDGPIETYLSITYITEKKLIGKMSYTDGDPLDKDDWFNVNFERVEEFNWEK